MGRGLTRSTLGEVGGFRFAYENKFFIVVQLRVAASFLVTIPLAASLLAMLSLLLTVTVSPVQA